MRNNILRDIIKYSDVGYALCKVVLDKNNEVRDYIYLEVNEIYEKIFGVEQKKLHNQQASKILPLSNAVTNYENYIKECGKVAISGKPKRLELYFKNIETGYGTLVISPKKNYFIILIKESKVLDRLFFERNIRYEELVNSMNDVIFVMNTDFSIAYFSPSIEKVLGFSADELIGKRIDDILSPKNVKIIDDIVNEELRSSKLGEVRTIEMEQTHKNGQKVVMEYLIHFLYDDDKQFLSIMGVGRDITEWVKAKTEVSRSKEELSLILNSTAEGIIGLDQVGYIKFCNKSALKHLGYDKQDDLIGKHIQIVLGIDNDPVNFSERFEEVFKKGVQGNSEVDQFIRKDGSTFVSEYYLYPQENDGEIIGAVITFLDITERNKIRNELYEAERSKSVLISNLPGMAYRCAFDRHWTIQFVSDGCYDLTGYAPSSLINNFEISFNDLILPQYREHIWNHWVSLIGKEGIFKEEYQIKCKNGEIKWVLEKGQIIYDRYHQVEGIEGLIIDITDLKKKQEEIEYLSFHDSLTGLNNRIYFDRIRMKLDREENLPLSLIICDINGLKLINETLGHFEGDKMIAQTAKLLKEHCYGEEILARTSGDEFSFLLPNTTSEETYKKMKAIMESVEEYNKTVDNDILKIKIALGFATKESLDMEYNTMQKIAEDYMYKRKLLDRSSFHSTILNSIQRTLFEKSQITEEHAERLQMYSRMLGVELNLSQVELDELALISKLHDIGKIGIDDRILKKDGPLTDEEWLEMRRHPEIGYRIAMASPDLISIAPYILSHHERWDGSGYPHGLKGEEIPLLARIISISDAYDAMTEDRPYRRALSKDEALSEIAKNKGTQFDPNLVDIFIRLMKD